MLWYIFTAPYYIIQPSTDDTVHTATTNFQLACTLNVEIPAGMTVTWSHNGTVIWRLTNPINANSNTVYVYTTITERSEAGVYQCALTILLDTL